MSCLVTCAERSTVLNQANLQAKHTAYTASCPDFWSGLSRLKCRWAAIACCNMHASVSTCLLLNRSAAECGERVCQGSSRKQTASGHKSLQVDLGAALYGGPRRLAAFCNTEW